MKIFHQFHSTCLVLTGICICLASDVLFSKDDVRIGFSFLFFSYRKDINKRFSIMMVSIFNFLNLQPVHSVRKKIGPYFLVLPYGILKENRVINCS